jgi:hypothetical protein
MPRVAVESKRLPDGGYVVSAHVGDWDLLQSFPHTICADIVDAIVKRFVKENGDMIMKIVQDPDLLATALSKEIDLRVRSFIAERKKRDAR